MAKQFADNIKIAGFKADKPKLKSDGLILPFYQTKKSLKDLDAYNKFIKGVESLIRKSKEYKAYKDYLMNDVGLNYCMMFPNITTDIGGDKPITIEMHHGPILTLYDYCAIVTDHYLKNDIYVNSFRIFKAVMDEHFQNNVQVVMLCDLAHKGVHDNKIFLNVKQGWGHLDIFLEKYIDGISDKMEVIINKNLEMSRKYDSFDKDGMYTLPDILEGYGIRNL